MKDAISTVGAPVTPSDLARYEQELRWALLNYGLKLGLGVGKQGNAYAWMIDSREVLLKSPYLRYAARLLWERLKPYKPQMVGGMTLAANPLTIAVLYESWADGYEGLDAFIIRQEPKGDGLRKQIEGPPIAPGTRVVLVDDLINSGDTQYKAVAALTPFAPKILAVGALIDYHRAGTPYVQSLGIETECLFRLDELGIAAAPPLQEAPLVVRWQVALPNRASYAAAKSGPCVVGDKVFAGSDTGHMLALTLSGEELWRFAVRDVERGVHASARFWDGKIYFGAYDGFMYCLDANSGALVWEVRLGQWVGSSAAIDSENGLLYVGVESAEANGTLVALDLATGARRWEFRTSGYIHSSPCWDAPRQQVIVGCNDHALYAVDAKTGVGRWRFQARAEFKGGIVVDEDGACFAGCFDGSLYAVEAATGEPWWRRRIAACVNSTPLIAGDLVLVGGHSARMVALDRFTGDVRWVVTAGDRIMGGAVRVDAARVAFGSNDGALQLIALESGKLLARYLTGAPIMTTPAVAPGLVLVPSCDGHLYALEVP